MADPARPAPRPAAAADPRDRPGGAHERPRRYRRSPPTRPVPIRDRRDAGSRRTRSPCARAETARLRGGVVLRAGVRLVGECPASVPFIPPVVNVGKGAAGPMDIIASVAEPSSVATVRGPVRDRSAHLQDLMVLPDNRLNSLKGGRKGQHGIRSGDTAPRKQACGLRGRSVFSQRRLRDRLFEEFIVTCSSTAAGCGS